MKLKRMIYILLAILIVSLLYFIFSARIENKQRINKEILDVCSCLGISIDTSKVYNVDLFKFDSSYSHASAGYYCKLQNKYFDEVIYIVYDDKVNMIEFSNRIDSNSKLDAESSFNSIINICDSILTEPLNKVKDERYIKAIGKNSSVKTANNGDSIVRDPLNKVIEERYYKAIFNDSSQVYLRFYAERINNMNYYYYSLGFGLKW